ncbi:MAG: ABC transporter substrate-binding protein [Bryobacteraceae bacterium]
MSSTELRSLHRLPLQTVAIMSVLLLAPSCRVRSAGPKHANVRMAVPAYTSLVQLPLVLAQELGFFADEGLEVTMSDMSGGSKALESLLAGSTDVVSSFHDQTLLLAAQGRDLKAFVLMLQSPAVLLVASPRAHIRRIQDLRGSTVAVTAPGSPVHLYVEHLLIMNGLSGDDISVIGTPSTAARFSALETGKVGAAILGEPGLIMLRKRHPDVTVLADLMTRAGLKQNFGTEVYPGTALISTASWLQANPTLARGIASAVKRALRWCRDHTAHEIAERMPAAFRTEDRAGYEQSITHLVDALSRDGIMPREAAEAEKRMLSLRTRSASFAQLDVSRTFTNEYVSESRR